MRRWLICWRCIYRFRLPNVVLSVAFLSIAPLFTLSTFAEVSMLFGWVFVVSVPYVALWLFGCVLFWFVFAAGAFCV
jgi:hypothetical protein